jgi:hypothetical protein
LTFIPCYEIISFGKICSLPAANANTLELFESDINNIYDSEDVQINPVKAIIVNPIIALWLRVATLNRSFIV